MNNSERIRKIIQIQGPNINYHKHAHINVIEQAEKLMENQHLDIDEVNINMIVR